MYGVTSFHTYGYNSNMKRLLPILLIVMTIMLAGCDPNLQKEMNEDIEKINGVDTFSMTLISCNKIDSYEGEDLLGQPTTITPLEGNSLYEVKVTIGNKTGEEQSLGTGFMDGIFMGASDGYSYRPDEFKNTYYGIFFTVEANGSTQETWHFEIPEEATPTDITLVGSGIWTVEVPVR